MKSVCVAGILAVLLSTSTGCAVFDSGRNALTKTTRMFRPRPFDEPIDPMSGEDEWEFVGKEGRGDQPRERDPERWLRNLTMSSEARNIERNLGID